MLISTPIPDNASITMTRAEYMAARQDAVDVALPEVDALRQQLTMMEADYTHAKDERDLFKNRVEELLTEQLHLLEVPVKYEQKFNRLESILGIDADEDEDVINAVVALKAENAALRVRIAALEAPAAPLPVTPAQPVITKTDLKHIAGVTITLDAAPSERKDAAARELIQLAADTGFNTVRFMRNYREAVEDVNRVADLRSVSGFAKSLRLTIVYDTIELVVQAINRESLTDDVKREKIKRYFDALKTLGGSAIYINDADRDDLKADLSGIVAQIRAASDLPLIASLTATADLDTYRKLFDHIEIQTFGTLDEFARYKAIPMSILCIDGQHDASNRYLREMLDMVGYRSFFVYTMYDRRTDWRNMPDTVDIYRVFLQKWKAQRG